MTYTTIELEIENLPGLVLTLDFQIELFKSLTTRDVVTLVSKGAQQSGNMLAIATIIRDEIKNQTGI